MLNAIKQVMRENKIDVFGITSTTNFSFLKERFDKKFDNNFLADFDSASFDKRAILDTSYPNAKSIISIVFPYPHFRKEILEQEKIHNYKISEYACIPDYHSVIKSALSNIISRLESIFPDFYFTQLVDSNPLFEKEIAKLCGTGTFGKNSLIYNQKYGSYIFLSEIITNCSLPDYFADSIPHMLCNSCNLCINSCPNCAIEEPFMINAKKCVSYYTSSKQDFDPSLLNGYLWGCDICQSSCPVNKKSDIPISDDFFNSALPFIPLEEIILSSNKKLSEIYKEFPIGWSGMSIIRRNGLYLLYKTDKTKAAEITNKILNEDFPDFLKSCAHKLKISL